METYRELLSQQVATLQTYFDACANAVTKGFEPYQKECKLQSSFFFKRQRRIVIGLDENANELDFEEPLYKNDTTSMLNDEAVKNTPSKHSLLYILILLFSFDFCI